MQISIHEQWCFLALSVMPNYRNITLARNIGTTGCTEITRGKNTNGSWAMHPSLSLPASKQQQKKRVKNINNNNKNLEICTFPSPLPNTILSKIKNKVTLKKKKKKDNNDLVSWYGPVYSEAFPLCFYKLLTLNTREKKTPFCKEMKAKILTEHPSS